MTALDYFRARLDGFLDQLRDLVELESPSGDPAGTGRVTEFLEQRLRDHGTLDRVPLEGFGPLLRFERPGRGARVLLSAHSDTVWPIGSWATRWRVMGDRASGPGVYDMKAGLLFIPWLLEWLDSSGRDAPLLEVVVNPDEEVGSVASRPWLEDAARRADVALVLEPTAADGCLKVARKGSGEYLLTVHGRSAHQGVEPENGANAVLEAARQAVALASLCDPERGTTVGPNVIRGGSLSNVVPDRCELRIDVRAWTTAEQRRLTTALETLEPSDAGTRLALTGGWNRPPMEPTEASMALYRRARDVGRHLGVDPPAARWGGSSDANLIAAVGTPCVDGFGAVGAGAHQPDEHVVVSELPRRMALLAETVVSLVEAPVA